MTDSPEPPRAPKHGRTSDGRSAQHSPEKPESKKLRNTLWVVVGVLAFVIVFGGWLGIRVVTAKNSLEDAQGLIPTVKTQATSLDFAGLQASAKRLSKDTQNAVEQTKDPIWHVAEVIPVLGKNLTAVRETSQAINTIAQHTVMPLATASDGLSVSSLKLPSGGINVPAIKKLATALGPASKAFDSATKQASAIDFSGTIGPVASAGTQIIPQLTQANALLKQADEYTGLAVTALGGNGPRHYVLTFLNNAEVTALGGTAASLAEITLDNGSVTIGTQASSQTFPWQDFNPIIPPDPNLENIYTPGMYTRLNLATSRPDFPTAAKITQAFWAKDIGGDPIDGVISIDPVALSHILAVTGPVHMDSGDQLDSSNVVATLLNQVYFRYPADQVADATDAFFADAAKSIFGTLMATKADPKALLKAVGQGVDEGRIMAWSSHPDEEKLLDKQTIQGVLPTTNSASTTTGVYFRDTSTSKMDYYVTSAVSLTTDVCTAANPTFTAKIDLHNTITPQQALGLPAYVASGTLPAGQVRTQIFVYGPPGAKLASNTINVGGVQTVVDGTSEDLGRPVIWFESTLAPGQSSQVTATFTGARGKYATPALRVTPMLNPTTTAVVAPGCAASPAATATPSPAPSKK